VLSVYDYCEVSLDAHSFPDESVRECLSLRPSLRHATDNYGRYGCSARRRTVLVLELIGAVEGLWPVFVRPFPRCVGVSSRSLTRTHTRSELNRWFRLKIGTFRFDPVILGLTLFNTVSEILFPLNQTSPVSLTSRLIPSAVRQFHRSPDSLYFSLTHTFCFLYTWAQNSQKTSTTPLKQTNRRTPCVARRP
jgi:hypothetical protein